MRKVLLCDANPELAQQLVDKSLLDTVGSSCKDKVEWECKHGHRWFAIVANRAKKGYGCPYCSGRLPIPGETDLATTHPKIASELVDQSLAAELKPTSHKKVAWRCKQGHTWEQSPAARVSKGSGCPYCSGRKAITGETDLASTHPELAAELVDQSLATKLKKGSNCQVEWRCKNGHIWRQSPNARTNMGCGCPYCHSKQPVTGENDLATTHPELASELQNKRLAHQLLPNSNKKVAWRCKKGHVWTAAVSARVTQGQGCPYCSGRRVLKGFNDLATVRPDIAAQLEDKTQADKVTVASHKHLTWRCDLGHTWQAAVAMRTTQGQGCPYCSGRRVLKGFNDLATTHPTVADKLTDPKLAHEISFGSNRLMTWQGACGHTWQRTVSEQVRNDTCPKCMKSGTSAAERDLANVVKTLMGEEEVLTNDRKILPNNLELDIAIPSKRVAIEFNGVWWHSERKGDTHDGKNRHEKKRKLCEERGWELIQIWEDVWNENRRQIITMLATRLDATEKLPLIIDDTRPRVGARQCRVETINRDVARTFLKRNHLQGATTFTDALALSYKGDICAILAIRPRNSTGRTYGQDGDWEIVRYATDRPVTGGFSKLLAHMKKNLRDRGLVASRWITFSDCDTSQGDMYKTCGFTCDKELKADYRYAGGMTQWKRAPKERFQKRRFRDDPNLVFDEALTERELAERNGLYRCYDSGKKRWVRKI